MDIVDILNNWPGYGGTGGYAITGIAWIFKLAFGILIIGYIIYCLLLTFRIRILADTVNTPFNKYVKALTNLHLLISIVVGFLSIAIILMT